MYDGKLSLSENIFIQGQNKSYSDTDAAAAGAAAGAAAAASAAASAVCILSCTYRGARSAPPIIRHPTSGGWECWI